MTFDVGDEVWIWLYYYSQVDKSQLGLRRARIVNNLMYYTKYTKGKYRILLYGEGITSPKMTIDYNRILGLDI